MSDDSRFDHLSGRDRLEALLPFYLNGTLFGRDLDEVEAWIESDPDALAALAEAEFEFSATQAGNEAVTPPADALSRFTKALDAEAGTERPAPSSSWFARLWGRVAALPPSVAWATVAAALVLIVVQAGVGNIGRQADYHVAGVETGAQTRPFILVSFKPDARMADISALLEKEGAAIEGGPKPGGFYRIAIPVQDQAAYDRVAKALAGSQLVQQVVPGRRPGNGS